MAELDGHRPDNLTNVEMKRPGPESPEPGQQGDVDEILPRQVIRVQVDSVICLRWSASVTSTR